MLARDRLDDDAWEEIEETPDQRRRRASRPTREIVERLRERTRVLGTRSAADLRGLLAEELVAALEPGAGPDRSGHPARRRPGGRAGGRRQRRGQDHHLRQDRPGPDRRRAHACCSARPTPSGPPPPSSSPPGPAGSVPRWSGAGRAATRPRSPSTRSSGGGETGVDTVLIDTAGRLQNKVGLMDELGKVKRVVEKHGPVDETLLILDATTGQNGLEQARVFTEVVDVTGVVLTKLDGTAKGGIVIAVQRKLGIPVKLVGLGEGPDDLAPFDPKAFVDALLGDA